MGRCIIKWVMFMTVRVRDRLPSGVQFIDTARELVVHTIQYAKKFPKSLMFFITKDLVDTSKSIYKNVVIANSIYPKSKLDVELRYKYLVAAKGYVEALDGLLSIAEELYNKAPGETKISDYGWVHWGELLETELKLIKSVITSDAKIKFDA